MNRIKKIINNPYWLIYYFLIHTGLTRVTPDKLYLKLQYFCIFNKKLDLKNPKSYNEKLQWLKLYDRKPEYSKMVDKYEVKKYVESKIGKEYIIPTLGVWEKFDDIDFDDLPDQFVLKCTHDSGSIIICPDKSKFDYVVAKKKLSKNLMKNPYLPGREWVYKDIKPRIIAEQFMVDKISDDLKDYKLFCFNGIVKLIQVDFNRHTNHKRNLYSSNWDFINKQIEYPNDPNHQILKPKMLNRMLELASIISRSIPHVRTDFYYINETIYFGELTFYHGSGQEKFKPESLNVELGKCLILPN
jgi:hypothetical protein